MREPWGSRTTGATVTLTLLGDDERGWELLAIAMREAWDFVNPPPRSQHEHRYLTDDALKAAFIAERTREVLDEADPGWEQWLALTY